MLTIKCSRCKSKLYKYYKVGKGKVIKCHKSRIKKQFGIYRDNGNYKCKCGNIIGSDEDSYIKMNNKAFIYTGTKEG
ncbi:hypothetical protein PRVXT_001920 [Proteinivorax tanatarense]|uniref:Uncharacterized protein n=1 Tax=Proteinivorax tanatarense TaxID=1260629 RepID=A0AAU7VIP4_9FIRM